MLLPVPDFSYSWWDVGTKKQSEILFRLFQRVDKPIDTLAEFEKGS